MEFPAHIVFSCLLVCQPAIFVDSKRDGTGAAHGRKGFRMKRAELDRRIANGETLDDIVPALMDDGADITSYDDLKRFAIEKIESDELYLAEHGIHFYYGDEPKPVDSFFKPKRRRKVRCTETGVVYESIKDAAERTKISPNGIGSAASGMAGGYHWEYADD